MEAMGRERGDGADKFLISMRDKRDSGHLWVILKFIGPTSHFFKILDSSILIQISKILKIFIF